MIPLALQGAWEVMRLVLAKHGVVGMNVVHRASQHGNARQQHHHHKRCHGKKKVPVFEPHGGMCPALRIAFTRYRHEGAVGKQLGGHALIVERPWVVNMSAREKTESVKRLE